MSVRDLAAAVAHGAAQLQRPQADRLAGMVVRCEAPPNVPRPSAGLSDEAWLAGAALREHGTPAEQEACREDAERARRWTADHGRWAARIAAERAVLAVYAAGYVEEGSRRDHRRWSVQTWERLTWAWRSAVGPLPHPAPAAAGLFDPPDPRRRWTLDAQPVSGGPAELLHVDAGGPLEAAAAAADLLGARPGAWRLRAWPDLDAVAMQGRLLAGPGLPAPAVLIPCGAQKLPVPARADELYTGQHFRLGLRCARALAGPQLVWVVSARHGVVPAGRVLQPYDRRMPADGATGLPTDPGVVRAVNDRPLVVSLLPAGYERAADLAGVRVDVRGLAGAAGIGYQRAVLAGLASAAPDPPGDPLARDPARPGPDVGLRR